MKKRIPFFLFLFLCLVTLKAQPDSILADSLYSKAKDFYYDGKYKLAEPLFQQALVLKKKFYGADDLEVMWNYRRLARTAESLRDFKTAQIYYDSTLFLANKHLPEIHEDMFTIHMDLGFFYHRAYRMSESQEQYLQALKVARKLHGEQSSAAGDVLGQIGDNFINVGDYQTAEEYLLRAIAIFQKTLKPDEVEFYRAYNSLSYLYRKLEEFEKSLDYGKRALEIKLKHYAPGHPSVAKYHRNLGRIHQEQGQYEEAYEYFETAMKIAENALGTNHPSTGGQYGEMGNILADMKRYDEAIRYMKLCNKVRTRYNDTLHPLVINGYHNIARIYHDKGDYPQALKFHQTGLGKFLSRDYPPPINVSKAYRDISRVYEDMDDPFNGLKANKEAFRWLSPRFEPGPEDFYSLPDLKTIRSPIDYLDALEDRAYLLRDWYAKDTIQIDRLEQALNSLEQSVLLIETLRRRYDSEAARKYLNSNRSGIFELGVRTAYELYQRTDDPTFIFRAFQLSEKSRASILWQSLQENIALKGADLAPSFLDKVNQIGSEIKDLELQLMTLDEEGGNSEKIGEIEKGLFEKNQLYEQQIRLLEQSNPRYYQLKYAAATIDKVALQSELNKSEKVLLEYFYDHKRLYIIFVDGQEMKMRMQLLPKNFENWVRQVRDQDVNKLLNNDVAHQLTYREALFQLYDILLQPFETEITKQEQLLIIPYGVLQYIPFGILAKKNDELNSNDFRSLSYLIKSHSVQYAWSVSLLQQSQKGDQSYSQTYLGFAPKFNLQQKEKPLYAFRAQLMPLNYNQFEIKNGQQYFSGSTFLADQATESQFCRSAPNSRILHLATHTIIDDERPMRSGLVFSPPRDSSDDGFLSTREIYDLHLPADLAVMSACNTGFGKLAKGEGVLSLGRAFTYAGCQSILMSLWLSNDQSTASLVDYFYQHLAAGKTKDVALRQAKLDYLANADGLMAHPYFWGGMVMVGEADAFSVGISSWKWIFIIFVSLLLFCLFFLFGKYRSAQSKKS